MGDTRTDRAQRAHTEHAHEVDALIEALQLKAGA